MIDAGIYNALGRGVKSVRDWQVEDEQRAQAAQAQELNALNLSNARATAGDNALVRQDQATIRNALAGMKPGATQEELAGAYEGTRTPTGLTQAQAIRKALAEAAKLKAQTDAATAAAGASGASRATSEYKLKIDQHTQALKDISTFQAPADALADVQRKAQSGELPMDRAQAVAQQIQSIQTPEQWKQWQQQTRYRLLDVKDQLEQEWKAQEAKRNEGKDALAAVNQDIVFDASGRPVVNQQKQQAAVERARAGASQNVTMGSPVAGVDDKGNPVFFQPSNRPNVPPQVVPGVRPNPKGSGASMSPTLQKELIESDEMVAGAQSVKSALAEALRLNDKAYSGVQALTRAKVRSNLPGQSAEADATIQFDNIIRESALTGMKAIFGGNPTEGERAILLEIQASSEKTPAQRKAILERAMKAADRRAGINAGKAKAIRDGSYLTEGAPQQAEEPAQPAGNGPSVSNW